MTLISCSNKEKQVEIATAPNQTAQELDVSNQIVVDTLLEYNSPDLLDMSKHQLFIDTSKNSKYYKQIADWKPNKFDIQGIDYYFREISKTFESEKVNLMGFPRDWISLHSLNNEYVVYNPINGIDWRFSLTDSTVNQYRVESDTDLISKVIMLKPEELILELRTIPQKNKNQVAFIRIKKTKNPHIYSYQRSETSNFETTDYINLITPIEHLTEFNLVVSDAPQLVHSIVKFDKVEKDKLE